MTSEVEFNNMVAALAKPGHEIMASLTQNECHLIHMVLGISGEAGELLDAVKKHTVYNKPLDRQNVIEELGDLEFYMQGLRDSLSISREETLKATIDKLGKRYPNRSYSNQDAIARADKQ